MAASPSSSTAPVAPKLRLAVVASDPVSPNQSGTVNGGLSTTSPTTGNRNRSNIIQSVNLSISGQQADYTGGYVEVKIDNGNIVSPQISALAGVRTTNTLEGTTRVLRFYPNNLKGGQDYNLVFNYALTNDKDNWSKTAVALDNSDFTITTAAKFLDKDGLLVKDYGTQTHQYQELYNAPTIGHTMTNWQLVGYDKDKDGLVDAGASKLTFFVATGFKRLETGESAVDTWSPGTGVFDGRLVTGTYEPSGNGGFVAPVSTYTYTVGLKPGLTLSQESKNLGWVEDATGYHLKVDRNHNPIGGDSKSNIGNSPYRVPISFEIVGAKVTDVANTSKTMNVSATYTKDDGTSYTNIGNTSTYNANILTAEPTAGVLGIGHYLNPSPPDSDITKAYGRAYYDTRVGLTNNAMLDQKVDMNNYAVIDRTLNDNEYYRQIDINRIETFNAIRQGGSVLFYNNDTGELLGSMTTPQRYSLAIDEAAKVKSIRTVYKDFTLMRPSDPNTQNIDLLIHAISTYFDNWPAIYNDASITSLWSKTAVDLVTTDGTVVATTMNQTELVRVPMTVYMTDNGANATFTSRSQTTNYIANTYTLTDTRTTSSRSNVVESEVAALAGTISRVYLADPALVPVTSSDFDVIYNYNGTGKDLYLYKTKTEPTTNQDIFKQPRWTIANPFIPNGTYTVTDISYWNEKDPNLTPTDGINLGDVNGVAVTTENSTTKINTINLITSEASGVISKVKSDSSTSYSYNTNGQRVGNLVDFELTFSNIAKNPLQTTSVITSLPLEGDKQLDTGERKSEFTVYLTKEVTPPAGWQVVYTTTSGNAQQIDAGEWLSSDQVTDWSTIRAIKFIATTPVAATSQVNFHIEDAKISSNATQGEKAYLSSASSIEGAGYIESNNVLIQMATEIPDGTVTVAYKDETGNVIAAAKVISNDVNSDYDVSNKETYYPERITATDGLPYVYVTTAADSAPNAGIFTEAPKTITHIYKLLEQKASFTFLDVTDSSAIKTLGAVDEVKGGSGQAIAYSPQDRLNAYLKQGYELVASDVPENATYDTDDTVDQLYTIKLQQRIVPVTTDNKVGTPVDANDPHSPVWPASVADLETAATTSRAIEYRYLSVTGKEAKPPVVQTAEFARTATVNLVTGAIVYSNWTPESKVLPAVVTPDIPGYTANFPVVSEVTAEPNQSIGLTLVIYTPNEQMATVTYIDQSTGEVLQVDKVTGKTDESIDYTTETPINSYMNLGYELVSDNFPTDGKYDNNDAVSQDFYVVLKPVVQDVTPDYPINPKTGEAIELHKTVTRTIAYKYLDAQGGEAAATVTQTADFTRTATVNMVTGQVTYGEWSAAQELPAVASPVLAGYTASVDTVSAKSVTAMTDDSTELVIYTPNEQTATVTYLDQSTGQTLEVKTLTGHSDESIDYGTAERIAYYQSLGYELVSDDFPANAAYDTDDAATQAFTVVLKPILQDVTPDYPINPKTGEAIELRKTVTRTIAYKYLDAQGSEAAATVTQTADFTRTATVNMVTGEVIYGEWSAAQELPAVASPVLDGYTANVLVVDALDVSVASEDSSVVVIYKPIAKPTPSDPEVPAVPEKPAESETPEVPQLPEAPKVPEQPMTPELPEVPEVPEQPETPKETDNIVDSKEVTPVVPDEEKTVSTPVAYVSRKVTPQLSSADKHVRQLPNTGEKTSKMISLTGLSLAAMSLVILFALRQKKEGEQEES